MLKQKLRDGYKQARLIPRYLLLEIPNDWNLISIRKLTIKHNSGIFKNRDSYGSGSNIVGVSDLYDNYYVDGQTFNLVNLSDKEKVNHILQEGDLIYAESSLVRDGIAKTLYVTKKGADTLFEWHTRRISLSDHVVPAYAYYCINLPKIRASLISRSTTTVLTGITTKEYFDTLIPFPPTKSEQQKISSILSNIDSLIQQTQKEIEQTQRLKKGLMQRLSTRGIGHTKFKTVIFGTRWMETEIPINWEFQKLKKIAQFRQGLQIAKVERFSEPAKDRLKLIKVDDFLSERQKPEYITIPSDSRKSVVCTKDDIIVARTGTIGLVLTDVEGVFHNNTFVIDYNKTLFHKMYFYYYLTSEPVQLFIKIISTRTSQGDLTHREFGELGVPIPPLPEQRKIASVISDIESKIQKNQESKFKLETLKKGLMQKLLTGQMRVKI